MWHAAAPFKKLDQLAILIRASRPRTSSDGAPTEKADEASAL
jgi:hypothetical protein